MGRGKRSIVLDTALLRLAIALLLSSWSYGDIACFGCPKTCCSFQDYIFGLPSRELLLASKIISSAALSRLIAPSTIVSLAAGWAFLLPSLVTRFGSQRTSATSLHLYVVLMTSTLSNVRRN